ncbi:GIY-YIG nuclease family protein [Micromonospora echinospora]|uniref:GIY-YIG nuclease family protein n=1 Tax=Micromonospora echinospora TaxID=1877 RepID=UPI00378D70E2
MTEAAIDIYNRPTALYRFYDQDDAVIYVGVTADLETRWMSHKREKPWWPEVSRREVEWYPDRHKALQAEAETIEREKPRYNVAGTPAFADRLRSATGPCAPSRHRNKPLSIRPDRDLQERTKATLAAHDWSLTEFVTACMELVNRNPDAMLGRLNEFKPPRVRGRPPKQG